jgi:hypothetical protein
MGRQTIHFAMVLAGVIGVLQILAMCLPFHIMYFYTLAAVNIGKVKIYTGMAVIDTNSNDVCKVIRLTGNEVDACEEVRGGHSLQDISHRFCNEFVMKVIKGACNGMSCAYGLGIATIILVITNITLEGVGVWMTYTYVYNAPKKKYREVALIVVIVGLSLVVISIGLYLPLVNISLMNVELIGGQLTSIAFNIGKGFGIAEGYWMMVVSVIAQIVQIILLKHGKISEERRLVELKMQEEFEAELAIGGGNGQFGAHQDQWNTDPYGGGYGGGGGAYGMQPAPAYGSYGGQPQAPPSWGIANVAPPMPQGQWGAPPPQPGYGGYGY